MQVCCTAPDVSHFPTLLELQGGTHSGLQEHEHTGHDHGEGQLSHKIYYWLIPCLVAAGCTPPHSSTDTGVLCPCFESARQQLCAAGVLMVLVAILLLIRHKNKRVQVGKAAELVGSKDASQVSTGGSIDIRAEV